MPTRLVSFRRGGQDSWGVVREDGIVDLGARQGGSVLALLESGTSTEAAEEAAGGGHGHARRQPLERWAGIPTLVAIRHIVARVVADERVGAEDD